MPAKNISEAYRYSKLNCCWLIIFSF